MFAFVKFFVSIAPNGDKRVLLVTLSEQREVFHVTAPTGDNITVLVIIMEQRHRF
jgi:hypothetical protein